MILMRIKSIVRSGELFRIDGAVVWIAAVGMPAKIRCGGTVCGADPINGRTGQDLRGGFFRVDYISRPYNLTV